MTTHDKGNILALSGSALQNRNSEGLDNTNSMGNTASVNQQIFSASQNATNDKEKQQNGEEEDEDYQDDGFEDKEQDDYEF